MSVTLHKACPKCYFENPASAQVCEFCGWQLLDEQGEETIFMGQPLAESGNETSATAPDATQLDATVADSTSAPTRLEAESDTQQATQFQDYSQHQATAQHPVRAQTFNLAGDLAHFEVQQIIGKGGMGAVYKAEDQTLERNVAIKVLRPHRGLDQAGKDLLLAEARTICKLGHPNIVTVYDVARGKDNNFIIMEWIEGETLDKLIPPDGLTLDTALNYAQQIIQGLVHAHQNRIIHSDIKPQNIMLTGDAGIKILDFGIAGLVQKHAEHSEGEVVTNKSSGSFTGGSFNGTPGYMSPEQALGKKELDERSDVFAFGILFYQLLSGKRPFDGKTAKEKTAAIITGDFPALPQHIPHDIRAIVEHCLALSPRDRYQTTTDLESDLQRYLSGNPVSVINSKSYWLKKKTIKHKWPVLLVTLAMLGGVGQLTWQQIQAGQQAQREQLLTQFTRQVENLEADVQLTRMSPAHDTSASQQAWQASIDEIAANIPVLGDIAQGPGNYAMGRMHYVLQDYDQALENLQTAWDAGFREDRVAYYLALTHSALYQQQYAIIQNLDSNSAKRDRLEILDKKHKEPAVEFLQQGMTDSPFQAYAQALLSFYQGDNDTALTMLDELTDTPAWFYDHHILRGDILLNQADYHGSQGEQEKSNELANLALESYEKARQLGRSDLQVQLKPLSVFNRLITDALYGDGEGIPELLDKSKSYLDQAELIAPNDYLVPFNRALILGLKYNHEKWFKGDPLATQEAMITNLENALALSPGNHAVLLNLGLSYARKLGTLNDRDLSEPKLLMKATETFNAIPEIERDYFYYNSLGIFLSEQAVYESASLLNPNSKFVESETNINQPSALFIAAEDALNKARSLKTKRLGAAINLGSLYIQWASESSGDVANKKLSDAVKTFSSLLTDNPEHFVVHYYLGAAYRLLGRNQDFLFQDNEQSLMLSRKHLEKAEEQQSDHPYVANEMMLWFVDYATFLWQSGKDPSATLAKGVAYAETSLKNHPDNSLMLLNNNLNWLQIYLIQHFSPFLILPNYTKTNLTNTKTTTPPIIEVLPMLLVNGINNFSINSLQESEFPHDYNLIMAEYSSIMNEFSEAEQRYLDVREEHMGKAMHLLFQRQNYQRWYKNLNNRTDANNQNPHKEVANKLNQTEALLKQHFGKLWQQIRAFESEKQD